MTEFEKFMKVFGFTFEESDAVPKIAETVERDLTIDDVFRSIRENVAIREEMFGTEGDAIGGYLTTLRVHLTKAESAYTQDGDSPGADLWFLHELATIAVQCLVEHGIPAADELRDPPDVTF